MDLLDLAEVRHAAAGCGAVVQSWHAFFDCSVAETTLGWRPSYRWSEHEQIQ
jgi:hypothetical protein